MNMFCRILTYDQLIQYQKSLDERDGVERKKMVGLLYEKKLMDRYFDKKIDEILSFGGDLENLKKEMLSFRSGYEQRLKSILESINHLSDEDDRVRIKLLEHTEECHKNLREENYKIEQTLILENLNRKNMLRGQI